MIFSPVDWIFLALGFIALLGVFLLSSRYTGPKASEVAGSAKRISEIPYGRSSESENIDDSRSIHANFKMGAHSIRDFFDQLKRLPRAIGLPIGGFFFVFSIAVLSAVCTFLTGSLLQPNLLFFLLIFIFFCFGFYEVSTFIADSRARRFEEQLEQALSIIIGGLQSGLNVQESMGLISEHMKGSAHREFVEANRKLNMGISVDLALSSMVERYYSEGVYLFVCAVSSKWLGSQDTVRVFSSVRSLLKDRRTHSMKLSGQLSGARTASFGVALLPYGMLAYLYFQQRNWVVSLFEESLGRNLFVSAVVLQIVGLYWIQRQLKIKL